MKAVWIIYWLFGCLYAVTVEAESVTAFESQGDNRKDTPVTQIYDDTESLSHATNAQGAIVLPSGLRYQVLQTGSGDSPKTDDIVTVHHRGRTLSGNAIGDTYLKGVPQTFPLDQVIPGWHEALQLMKPGARWRLFVPPELAYGEKGWVGKVGPNEFLIYDLELVDIPVKR